MAYKNIEDRRKYDREYRKKNLEKRRAIERKYNRTHKEQRKEYHRNWYVKNKEKRTKQIKQWQINNSEKIKEYIKKWQVNNRSKINNWWNEQYRNNIKFNLSRRMKGLIKGSISDNRKGSCWEDMIDYTLDDLNKHLKTTIPEGYTWQDFLEGKLHIDHIIPISVFNYDKPEHVDFKKCWALENLRLLTQKDNLTKKDKIYKPFQPSLKISGV